jgi:hypothetical protein
LTCPVAAWRRRQQLAEAVWVQLGEGPQLGWAVVAETMGHWWLCMASALRPCTPAVFAT